jgi:hypothetical protein
MSHAIRHMLTTVKDGRKQWTWTGAASFSSMYRDQLRNCQHKELQALVAFRIARQLEEQRRHMEEVHRRPGVAT